MLNTQSQVNNYSNPYYSKALISNAPLQTNALQLFTNKSVVKDFTKKKLLISILI